MSDHTHTHAHQHRHAGHAHPPAPIGASILRQSAAGRLAVAAGVVALLWALIFWAMQ